MNAGSDVQREYFERIAPMLPELWQTAYAICGNSELAEYCLQYALTQHYTEGSRKGMGFRDGLRHELRTAALEEALAAEPANDTSFDWDELAFDDDPAMALLAAEERDARRIIALICGCGLSTARTARLMGTSPSQVQNTVNRVQRSLEKKLHLSDERRARQRLVSSVRRAMSTETASLPSQNALYRAFVGEISDEKPSRHLFSRAMRGLFAVIMVLFCIFLVWLAAVLIQPEDVHLEESDTTLQAAP